MAISVRPAELADLPAVLGLYGQLHPEDPPLSDAFAYSLWRGILQSAGRTVFVGLEGDAVLATAELSVVSNLTRGGRPIGLVENVVVDLGHRRVGSGRALLSHVVSVARDAGCYKVQLASGSPEATAFYVSCGFSLTGGTLKLPLSIDTAAGDEQRAK